MCTIQRNASHLNLTAEVEVMTSQLSVCSLPQFSLNMVLTCEVTVDEEEGGPKQTEGDAKSSLKTVS